MPLLCFLHSLMRSFVGRAVVWTGEGQAAASTKR